MYWMFPGIASKVFLKPFVTIAVAPVVTGIIIHFMFHIRCISIHKLLYFRYIICPRILPHLSVRIFLFFVCSYYIYPVCCNFSVCVLLCTAWSQDTFNISYSYIDLGVCVCVCVCTIYVSFQCLGLCILSNANWYKLHRFSLSSHSSPKWGILKLGGP